MTMLSSDRFVSNVVLSVAPNSQSDDLHRKVKNRVFRAGRGRTIRETANVIKLPEVKPVRAPRTWVR
jgi:hypothetical protein